MKNLKKLSRKEMKTVKGASDDCNPIIICYTDSDCCPGWMCGGPRQYCIAI
ncbi:CCPGW family putative bacteriocin [Chryseobacterium sp. Alg-005]|uniref:CCPGW family putative bacteriocin n=1 Tax=Chryseobacterium sp. Alg-005 TaxID=3159516 RepID=UPI0036F1F0C6